MSTPLPRAVSPPLAPSDRRLGVAAALATVALWSGFILLSRFGVGGAGIAPLDLAALRYAVAMTVTLPLLWRVGRGGLSAARCLALTATGGLGFGLGAYHGFAYAPAAHGAILMPGVLPLFTAMLAVFALGERPNRRKRLALGCVLAGIVALATGSWNDGAGSTLFGDMLFLCAVFSWACFTVLLRRWQVPALRATAIVSVLAGALYLPPYLLFADAPLAGLSTAVLLVQGFYQGVCATVLALITFGTAVRHLGPTTTTMITAATPAVAALAAVPLLGEPLGASAAAGALAVVAGGMLSARADVAGR